MYECSETRYSEAHGGSEAFGGSEAYEGSEVYEGSWAYGGSETYGYSEAYGCPYGASALGISTLMTGIGIGNDGKGSDEGSGMGGDDSTMI